MNRESLEIRFIVDAPHTEYQSDFNIIFAKFAKILQI